jgi:ATP-binding cassette subfamily B multidrug efflux pump
LERNKKGTPDLDKMPKFGRFGGAANRFAPTEKPRELKKTLKRLLVLFSHYKKALLAATILTLFASLFSLIVPLYIGKAINAYDIEKNMVDTPVLQRMIHILLICYVSVWLLQTINGVLMAKVTQRLVKDLRENFFSKLQRLPLIFYDSRSHGDTMSRMTNDVDNISGSIAQTTTELISSIFTLVGSLIMMLSLNLFLTVLALIAVPLFMILTKIISSRSRTYFMDRSKALGDLSGIIEESITGMKMVKAFNRKEETLKEFRAVNEDLEKAATKALIWAGFLMPFMGVISNLSFGLIAFAGGLMSVRGAISVGIVVSFLTYSKQFGRPLNNSAGMFTNIQQALVGAERVFEILDESEEQEDREEAAILENPKGEIEFRDVYFSYTKDRPVVKGISFKVHPGETIALVGETGAGKTTIVNLMTRFYDLEKGVITFDGIDLNMIRRRSLMENFSVVLQDTFLFTGTIRDNIRYARPNASDEDIYSAAKIAHAEDFILKLPKGYDTEVSGSSDTLSQGQRQLLAISRAVLSDAPVLILDEATSSVDTKTEKEIQKAMVKLLKGRTSIIIAHRLSTIRSADRIYVLENGKILEEGNHEELMDRKGRYYEMVVSQIGNGKNMKLS